MPTTVRTLNFNTQMWMNGMYATASLSRIVMTDTADYNAATNRELQHDLIGGWANSGYESATKFIESRYIFSTTAIDGCAP